jgi:hypothetical protein
MKYKRNNRKNRERAMGNGEWAMGNGQWENNNPLPMFIVPRYIKYLLIFIFSPSGAR